MAEIAIDSYVLEVLMRDLIGHDKSPSAFLVYLHVWSQTLYHFLILLRPVSYGL